MGFFGSKKQDAKKTTEREKSTTARRSRRIVQPGAAKSGGTGGGTKARSPKPKVKRGIRPTPKRDIAPVHNHVLNLDDNPPAVLNDSVASNAMTPMPSVNSQEDFGRAVQEDPNGPSRGGDAALIEFLVNKAELINPEQAQNAQQRANDEGLALDAALVLNGSLTESDLVVALSKECWVPHLKVDKYEIRKKALSTISLEDIQRFGVFPVDKLGSILNLAMINPLDEAAIQHIDNKTGLEVKKVVTSRSEFQACVDKYFGNNAQADDATDAGESRMFSQDLPAMNIGATQQLANANVAEIAPSNDDAGIVLDEDDFMDIADIEDLLGDGDEVAPALIESVALEPILEEPAFEEPVASNDDDLFHDFTDTAAVAQEPDVFAQPEPVIPAPKSEPVISAPTPAPVISSIPEVEEPATAAPSEEMLDLEFSPERAAAPNAEAKRNDVSFLEDLATINETPASAAPIPQIPALLSQILAPAAATPITVAPAPAADAIPALIYPAKRSRGYTATEPFKAPSSKLAVPAHGISDLIPVTEEEFQQSIAHGRVRIFEKWVGIQTHNRIINASAVDEQLNPLLEGLKEGAYAVSAS